MGSAKDEMSPSLSAACVSRLVVMECKDEVDEIPNHRYHVHIWEMCLLVFSIFSYILDVVFDVNLSINYYKNDELTFAILTMLFVLIPSSITIAISMRWYWMDESVENSTKRTSTCWCLRVTVMLLQLAPVLRYYDSLHHAWQCRQAEKRSDTEKQRACYKLMLKEDADAALLRVFECFLESAPQLVLQMTIIMKQYMYKVDLKDFSLKHAPQVLSIITSLVSIAWSMASYQRSIRFAQDNKQNLSLAGSMLQFTWHVLIAVSRILSFSMLATVFSLYTGLVAAGHWLLMASWLMLSKPPSSCKGQHFVWKMALSWVLGLVYLFVYISTREGRTRRFYLAYYAVFFFENFGMLFGYGYNFSGIDPKSRPWYFMLVLVAASASFVAGIMAMLVYYGWFHPSADLRLSESFRAVVASRSIPEKLEDSQGSQEFIEIDLKKEKGDDNMSNEQVIALDIKNK